MAKNKWIKTARYAGAAVITLLVLYNSVYFRNLEEVKAELNAGEFNAAEYAAAFWENELLPNLDMALSLEILQSGLAENPQQTFEDHSHALGIGNLRYFLVSGSGVIASVNENDLTIVAGMAEDTITVKIATEFIFGNAVRDATGLIDINEFSNTMEFNTISAELNKLVRERVLPGLSAYAQPGQHIRFTGALELNREHYDLQHAEIIPVQTQPADPE